MAVIDNLAPSKNKHIKGTSQNWFDAEIMEKISDRDKLYKKFKKSCLHLDKDNYKEWGTKTNLYKKKAYLESKLTENIGKPKELWNCLKILGQKFGSSISNINCLENDKTINFDVKDIAKDFSANF